MHGIIIKRFDKSEFSLSFVKATECILFFCVCAIVGTRHCENLSSSFLHKLIEFCFVKLCCTGACTFTDPARLGWKRSIGVGGGNCAPREHRKH
jgi:hypothetical protein